MPPTAESWSSGKNRWIMYLKSIEVQGFKSFANKILFEFHNGITGIVGPNGSGKSNVADAVRWVLGEQRSKQLRGGTMQDVIFSGTELRKPQGFAYVAITLDNSDQKLPISFEEVTISRRLYRSGESEYKINGSACRLKDINELFYDTGIGKEGYSIIGQGQIDRILSGKPEERRELFDEAAGIVKFKRRKVIAQKKLEDEKQNLLRVSDILSELEKQVGPLKKQSEAAREYLRLKENQKNYDANLFLAETEAVKGQQGELEEKERIVTGDLQAVRAESERLKAEYEALSGEVAALEDVIAGEREAASQAGLKRQSLEGQINVLNEQINTERMNEEHIKNRIGSIEEETSLKQSQKEAYITEWEQLALEIRQIGEELQHAKHDLESQDQEITEAEQRIEAAKADIITALNDKAGLAGRKQRYDTMLEQVDVRRAEVSQRLLKYKSDESVQDEEIKREQSALQAVEAQLEELRQCEESVGSEALQAEEEVKRLNRKLNSTQQEYHTNHTKLESLRNLAERYDGYGNSIRRVMEARDRIHGVHGVVADLISTSKEYETAIETALGGSIQNIVTESEQTAKSLIEYLKKNRYGRATFLPLGSISGRTGFSQPAALKEPGVLGLASDLVTVGEQYQGLAAYLLGRVVVVDQIDHAIALAKKYRYSLRIVTLDGELLSAGGSMTGGAFKNSSNLLGRKRELDELAGKCREALVQVESIQKELAENEALLSAAKEKLERTKEARQKAYLEQNTAQMNIGRLESRRQEIIDSSADLVAENRELEEQVTELRQNREKLARETEQLETLSSEKNHEIEEETGRLEQQKASREECAAHYSAVQLKSSEVRQKENFLKENLTRIETELERLLSEKASLSEGSFGSTETIAAKQAEIEAIKLQMEEALKESEAHLGAVQEKNREREEKTKRQKTFFDKTEELAERQNLLDRELFRLQAQKEKLTERMEQQINYMWEEYELTYSTAEQLKDESLTSIQEMKKQIDRLKGEIRALGNVNVNAIEDYKELSERYEFLKTQHDDLAAAEAALLKIIDELDTGMRLQFEEKFQEIRKEFDKVFKELFGGGHGTLALQEDADILEAGVQIISQPPGKKLQNMMQLSGGEKALTAIALLFAIQNLKPSPFCLLDEIEAALDDSNVDRFAGYLHKLTNDTQFIVITHRRGTMVAADRLYGITMQEKGVSTLVSVNLIEGELDK